MKNKQQIKVIITKGNLNRNSSDKEIEITYNKLFGNCECDCYICLSQEEIEEIRDLVTMYETIKILDKFI